MATLTLTVAASTDDAQVSDTGYDDSAATLLMGSAGSPFPANGGQGLRFTNVTLGPADTINLANLSLLKSTATWTNVDWRLTAINEDNTAAFSSGSPPGARAIVSGSIAAETLNNNHADATVYTFPSTSGLKGTLAAAIAAVLARAGWASGNAIGIVNNSAQDAGHTASFSREFYHSWDSTTASSEPQLVIDYTAAPAAMDQEGARFRNDDGSESTATWKAAQDTNINLASGSAFRLRMLLDSPADPGSQQYRLDFKKSTDSVYQAINPPPVVSLAYGAEGALAYAAASSTSMNVPYPTGITTRSILVMVIGQKPTIANAEQISAVPTGWSVAGGLPGAGGYGTTLGADTGNTNLYFLTKDVVSGTESGSVALTYTNTSTSGVTWAQILRIEANTDLASVAYSVATTSRTTTPTSPMTLTFGSDPGVTAGDYVIAAMCIPTDVTTPAQFSAESLSQTGVTFGAVTEISEPDSTNGNDIGGVIVRAAVTAGTSSAAPSLQMTLAGTLTNVRGPAGFLRIRGTPVNPAVQLDASSNIAASGATATTAQLTPPSGKTTANFTAGIISDDTNPVPAIDIASNGYTEIEWSAQLASGLTDGDVYQFRVTVGGSALTTYTVTPQITVGTGTIDASVTIAGVGIFSGGTPRFTESASFAGTATLSGGTPRFNSSAAIAGTSALASANPVFNSSVAVAGTSTLSATPILTSPASVALAGVGVFSGGSPRFLVSESFAGASTLAAPNARFNTSAVVAGVGALSVNAQLVASASAAFAGTSNATGGSPVFVVAATVAGTSVLSATNPVFRAVVGVSGVAVLAATNPVFIASVGAAGVGALTASYQYSGPAGAAVVGASSLSATPLLLTFAGANFVATANLATNGGVTASATVSMAGAGILAAIGSQTLDRSVAFVGAGALATNPTNTEIAGVSVAGVGTFSVNPGVTYNVSALFASVGTVQANPGVTQPASFAVAGVATFAATYDYGINISASAAFAGAGVATISSYTYFDARPAWAGTSINATAYGSSIIQLTAFVDASVQLTAYATAAARVT